MICPTLRLARILPALLLGPTTATSFAQSPEKLAPVVVTTGRGAQAPALLAVPLRVISAESIQAAPTLDAALKTDPAFSLFRRSDSLTANPTAQGVSLRGLGPSGASRSLVLLDGIPLNDPFGGWVVWGKVAPLAVAQVEIMPSGGAGAWGNATLGGVVHVLSRPMEAAVGHAQASLGDYGTHDLAFDQTMATGSGFTRVSARNFATNGFYALQPADRGSIDQPTALDQQLVQLSWSGDPTAPIALTLNARYFAEDRNNGTPRQRNGTEETFVSARLDGKTAAGHLWEGSAYAQRGTFESYFSAVADDRNSENPALDQYAVPADAVGGSWVLQAYDSSQHQVSLGLDLRGVRGETREHYFFVNNEATRERRAGGAQGFAGFFIQQDHSIAPTLHLAIATRVDAWTLRDGHRRETERATGAILREDSFADRQGAEPSGDLGLIWTPRPDMRVSAAIHRAFRLPTLNEYYRPFRVGDVITEANANLNLETVTGAELGIEHFTDHHVIRISLFSNILDNSVSNVTLGTGPGVVPGVGFVPAGGIGRQRQNLAEIRVQGIESSIAWQPTANVRIHAAYVLSDATVREAVQAPDLVGLQLPQVARHTATWSLSWQVTSRLHLRGDARWESKQYEDDRNTLVLPAATVINLSSDFALTPTFSLFARIDNATDAHIATGRPDAATTSYAPPRLSVVGLRTDW